VDVLGDATPERYRHAVELCARDPAVHGLMVLLTPQAMTNPSETARQLATLDTPDDKPVLACWMGGEEVRSGQRFLNRAGIPTFAAPEVGIKAFLHMVQYRRNQEQLYERPESSPEDSSPDLPRVHAIVAAARKARRTLLTEIEAKALLSAYGIPVTPTAGARTADQAVTAALRIGYPVVLKLLSETITHKSDIGGVQLNLRDDQAVRQAFATIQNNLAQRHPEVPFEGVTVQPMIRDKAHELIIGSTVDVQFGPVILFGAGGILVEVLKDRALALPPLNRTLARRLIERTRIHRVLQGVRGQGPIDFAALETLLVRFSLLLCDCPDIEEIDMNPVLVSPNRVVAVDARVLLCAADTPLDKRPRLAIHPYPNQYTAPHKLGDGTEVLVRAIRPEDERLIIEFHAGHSPHTIRMRFFSMVKSLSRESLIRLCHLDYDRAIALAAIYRQNGKEHVCGVSRFFMDPESREAEFAIVVGDAWQGKGLGWHLMQRLIDVARQKGVRVLVGDVLSENTQMLQLVQQLGFSRHETEDANVVQVRLPLESDA
jgi:acetyltransferase